MTNKPTDVFRLVNMQNGDESVCWEWKGSLNKSDGRPYFTCDGSRKLAYRIVYELVTGEELPNGIVVRHNCDNPRCCNPTHLTVGTHQDNMNDMKDRERHGVPKTVLRSIRKLLEDGRSHQDIADLYGLSREAITAINNERSHTKE